MNDVGFALGEVENRFGDVLDKSSFIRMNSDPITSIRIFTRFEDVECLLFLKLCKQRGDILLFVATIFQYVDFIFCDMFCSRNDLIFI